VAPAITWRWDNQVPVSGVPQINLQQTSYNACNTFFALSPPAIERDKQVGTLLRNAADTNIGAEHRYQAYRYAHRKLHQNPAWLLLGAPDDSTYQNFYNNYNPTNLGTLRQIEVGVDTGSAQFVSTICNNLTCSNLIEHNAKIVYSIYAATWMSGIYSFTPADSASLLVIANLDPVEGGTAVYSARVMLDLPVDYYGEEVQRSMFLNETNDADINKAIIYPNPASDKIQLEFSLESGQVGQFEIVDMNGKTVASYELSNQQNLHSFEISYLSSGIYMLRVLVDGEQSASQRLVITRD
jgi:hypothetical protein